MKISLTILSLFVVTGCLAQTAETKIFDKKSTTKTSKIRSKIVVAVIDTGIDSSLMKKDWLCPDGHKDFTGTGLSDSHGHGTHISGIIDQYAKDFIFTQQKVNSDIDKIKVDYCQIIIKYFDPKSDINNLQNTIKSFRWAIDQGVDIINYSGGGLSPHNIEKNLIDEALNKGIQIVAAAGNESSNIDENKYYPAMYDKRIHVVGNLVSNKVETIVKIEVDKNTRAIVETKTITRDVASSSNYGVSVNSWEVGTNVLSRLPNSRFGLLTGTSQSAAIYTGKLVRGQLIHGH